MKEILLYGGGTQSTGLLLMALDGLFKKPDMVIFSDTMGEPQFVYDYIKRVNIYIIEKYQLGIRQIYGGNLPQDIKSAELSYRINQKFPSLKTKRIASLPLFTESGGMIRRQCTAEYKIQPITKHIKSVYNFGRKNAKSEIEINRWFGISLDEIERCKISQEWWAINNYPLVEKRMYRHEVIDYINKNHPELANPPRSSCYFCPFHNDNYWRELKENHNNEFGKACKIDELIRHQPKLTDKCYLHRSRQPLKDVDFSKHGQLEIFAECDGYCGI